MKKFISLMAFLVIAVASFAQQTVNIDCVADLQALATATNEGGTSFTNAANQTVTSTGGFAGVTFNQTADLDLSSVCGRSSGTSWIPIGFDNNHTFKGTYDGGGHTISNLYINSNADYKGLFGFIEDAHISYITMENTDVYGKQYVGSVCGYAVSSISSATHSSISYCYNSGKVLGNTYVGGICGTSDRSDMIRNINVGNVRGVSDIGGVCGYSNNSNITSCINGGIVYGGTKAGGVTGTASISTLTTCLNSGKVSGNKCVGGVCGFDFVVQGIGSNFVNCYYDKQLCILPYGVGSTAGIGTGGNNTGAKGLLTSEMASTASTIIPTGLAGFNMTDWHYDEGMYPRPMGTQSSNVALLSAMPLYIDFTNASVYETVDSITVDFGYRRNDNVTVESAAGTVIIDNGTITVEHSGIDTIVFTCGNINKIIPVTVYPDGFYTVDNINDLVALSNGVNRNSTFLYKGFNIPAYAQNAKFKQTADIDMSSVCGPTIGNWNPIGNDNSSFRGAYDGDGYSISNLYINNPDKSNVGLFGVLFSSYISNLVMINTDVTGDIYSGSVCGDAYGNSTIINCSNSGSVRGNSRRVGGICGSISNGATITNCSNSGSVSGNDYEVGGIVGGGYGDITNCSNSGSVTGNYFIGGICGYGKDAGHVYTCAMTGCSNSGRVSGTRYLGGLCGYAEDNFFILNSINSGEVSGSGYSIGGVVGSSKLTQIHRSINTGKVSGSSNVGGVCGICETTTTMSYCYYDKQMCPLENGVGATSYEGGDGHSNNAAGKLTYDMIGTNPGELSGITSSEWVLADGMYPRPLGTENTDAAIVAATPIFLNSTSLYYYETNNSIKSDFTYGGSDTIAWSSTSGKISLNNGNATIASIGNDTLTATYGSAVKRVPLNIVNSTVKLLTIDNLNEFVAFRDSINTGTDFTFKGINVPAGGENTYFSLTTDIDLSSVCSAASGTNWTPIGSGSNPFKGYFNGKGHTVNNLYFNAPTIDNQGLFGYLYEGSIDSINLVNTNVNGRNRVGSVCGDSYRSAISHITNSGSVRGNNYVGGVCGYANKDIAISCSTNSGSVSGRMDYVGGVCGYANVSSTISYSTNSGSVSGDNAIGGIFGGAYNNSTVSNSYYDKQMCPVANGIGYDGSGSSNTGAEPKLTAEMTGLNPTGLTGFTGTDWIFADGMYPRPKGIENTNAAIVTATPMYLAATSSTNYETVDSIVSAFSYNNNNAIAWSSTNNSLNFNNGNVSLIQVGNDTITASLGNANKNIPVRIFKPISVSISGNDAICEGESITLTANSDAVNPTYQWYENNIILTDSISQTLTVYPSTTSVYKVRVADTNFGLIPSEAEKTVTVNNISTSDTTVAVCNTFTWYGNTYTTSGIYQETFQNIHGCDSIVTLHLTINTPPAISNITAPAAIVHDEALALTAPQITENGSTVTAEGWQISDTQNFTGTVENYIGQTLAYTYNNWYLRYYAENDCGTTYSNVVTITVLGYPVVDNITAPEAICNNTTLSLTAPNVDFRQQQDLGQGWQLSENDTFASYIDPVGMNLDNTYNGWYLRYFASNNAGTTYSNTVNIIVNEEVIINAISDVTYCKGVITDFIPFSVVNNGGTVRYEWTNDNTAIGLPASGSTNGIERFITANNTNTNIVANITVTPFYDVNGIECEGATEYFSITINPGMILNPVSDQIVRNGEYTTAIEFSSLATGGNIQFVWTTDNPNIGINNSGVTAGVHAGIPSFRAVNNGTEPIVATIYIKGYYGNGNTMCDGASVMFKITVLP